MFRRKKSTFVGRAGYEKHVRACRSTKMLVDELFHNKTFHFLSHCFMFADIFSSGRVPAREQQASRSFFTETTTSEKCGAFMQIAEGAVHKSRFMSLHCRGGSLLFSVSSFDTLAIKNIFLGLLAVGDCSNKTTMN